MTRNIIKRHASPLHLAIQNTNLKKVEKLIASGCDINAKDRYGYTPLHDALFVNDIDILRHLIDHGADLNSQNDNGWTPLHWAVAKGHIDLAILFIHHGANTAITTNAGANALDIAKKYNEEFLCFMLQDSLSTEQPA